MFSQESADELRRAALLRVAELREIVGNLKGPLGGSRNSLLAALELTEAFPAEVESVLEAEFARAPDGQSKIQIVLPLLRHLNYVLNLVENHFAHGTRRELSESLADEVREELRQLGLPTYEVVLSHGAANNFETVFGDLAGALFNPLTVGSQPPRPVSNFALFRVPRLEGGGVQWRPVLLGHEVCHVAVRDHGCVSTFDLTQKFDVGAASGIANPNARLGAPAASVASGLYRIAEAWTTELLCDAHAMYRFGPSGVASLAEYFITIGPLDSASVTHPPGLLRIKLLLDQLGPVTDPRVAAILRPWIDLIPSTLTFVDGWAQFLADLFQQHAGALTLTVDGLPAQKYDFAGRLDWIHDTADRLASGIPGRDSVVIAGQLEHGQPADVVNGSWLARSEGATTPFDRLAQKTLESIEFVRQWTHAGGVIDSDLHIADGELEDCMQGEAGTAILSGPQLRARLKLREQGQRLIAAPMTHEPKGSGLDLRLGTRFITFRRAGIASFDPLDASDDPRAVQVYVELSRTQRFVLHPQEIVLGATLEYLVMPDDLSGQVITRSSYGRLGLLSATAVQIHPGFRGCLTLELVNLSTIPITLTPGERIAQLVLWKSELQPSATEKYDFPIGPEFSRVRADVEAGVLRKLRDA